MLFQNFGKLKESAEANKQGVGLGLSICHEIIVASGGRVNIESELGEGTAFIISLKTKCRINMAKLENTHRKFELEGEMSPLSCDE